MAASGPRSSPRHPRSVAQYAIHPLRPRDSEHDDLRATDERPLIRSVRGEVLGRGRPAGGGGARLRAVQQLPHVLQVLRRLPGPLQAAGREARRRRAQGRRRGDGAGDGPVLPVQAVRGRVSVHAAHRASVQPRLPRIGAPLQGGARQEEGRQAARADPRRSRLGWTHGAHELRPGEHDEPRGGAPLVHGADPRRAPRQAAAGVRVGDLRGVGGIQGPRATRRHRRRGGPLPDLLRAEQRAAHRSRRLGGAGPQFRADGLRQGPGVLRHAGLGERQSRRGAQARRAQPRHPRALRRRRGQGARHQSDLLYDDAREVAEVVRGRLAGARAKSRRRRQGSLRPPVVDPRRAALPEGGRQQARVDRLPRPVPLARAAHGPARARLVPPHLRHAHHARDGVLRARWHVRHEGRRLRAQPARRRQLLPRHARRRGAGVVDRLSAGRHPVSAARRRQAHASPDHPRQGLSRRVLRRLRQADLP